MPNTKTAQKKVKTIATRTLRNKANRSDLRTAIKKADLALTNNGEDKEQVVRLAMKKIDRAVIKGILHKNNAARKKASLAIRLNRA